MGIILAIALPNPARLNKGFRGLGETVACAESTVRREVIDEVTVVDRNRKLHGACYDNR